MAVSDARGFRDRTFISAFSEARYVALFYNEVVRGNGFNCSVIVKLRAYFSGEKKSCYICNTLVFMHEIHYLCNYY